MPDSRLTRWALRWIYAAAGQSGTVAVSCPILSKGIRTALGPTRHFATCISYKIKAEHSTILSLMQSWAKYCFASTGGQDSPVKWFQVASKSALFGHCKHFCKSRTIQAVDNFPVALLLVTNFATFLSVHFWHLQPGGHLAWVVLQRVAVRGKSDKCNSPLHEIPLYHKISRDPVQALIT